MIFEHFEQTIKKDFVQSYGSEELTLIKIILHCLKKGEAPPSFNMYASKENMSQIANEINMMNSKSEIDSLTTYYIRDKKFKQIIGKDKLVNVEKIFIKKLFDENKLLLDQNNYHLVFIFSFLNYNFDEFGYALGKIQSENIKKILIAKKFDTNRFMDDMMTFQNHFSVSAFSSDITEKDNQVKKNKTDKDRFDQINKTKNDRKELDTYCINLNEKTDPSNVFFGRENEINQMYRILNKKTKGCPILLGEPGVGKTALVEKFVTNIQNKKTPLSFQNTLVFELSIMSVMAGARYRGDIEDRIKRILADFEKVKKSNDVIVFIDEIHMIFDAQSNSDIANLLKPLMARGDIKIIGATTESEWNKSIKNDPAFNRRFNPIWVSEPSIEDTKKILNSIKHTYEKKHCVQFTEEQIDKIVDLTSKFVNDSKRPDNAIDIMDMVGARAQIEMTVIDDNFIANTIAEYKLIPIDLLLGKNNKRIKEELNNKIIGQEQAVDKVYKSIIGEIVKTRDYNRPIGVYLFAGKTGVGKTQLSECIADLINCDLITLNMESYKDISSVNRLIGSPPGYVGYQNESIFGKSLRKNGRVLFLLDEVEKAHPDVLDIFLNIFDKGFIIDSTGNKLDFKNCFFIMTTNAKPDFISKNNISLIGDTKNKEKTETYKEFKPELLGRLDGICSFNNLTLENITKILELKISEFNKNLENKHGVYLSLSEELKHYLSEKAFAKKCGGRGISKVFNDEVKEIIDDYLLEGNFENGSLLHLKIDKGIIKISKKRSKTKKNEMLNNLNFLTKM